MKIKTEWIPWLLSVRRKEIELIFSKCPEKLFEKGLEIGAGDGFQSTLLSNYVTHLTCTDINPERLKMKSNEAIEYRICSAEELGTIYGKKHFDLIIDTTNISIEEVVEKIIGFLKEEGKI